jgi:UDP-3-O-[3-hydroxymyristoyl] glucosamine N-acyltransferase LpxD
MTKAINSFSLKESIPIRKILDSFQVDLSQCSKLSIRGISSLKDSREGYLCFCDRSPQIDLQLNRGAIVLCSSSIADELQSRSPEAVILTCIDPRRIFIDVVDVIVSKEQVEVSSAIPRPFGVSPGSRIASSAFIDPECLIEENVVVGENCVIHRGSWIQADTVIHDNTVIGVDGITLYKAVAGGMRKLPHLAGVVIGPNSEIGANCSLCRGILNDTLIGENVIIGNQCSIGHVASIGDNVWMSVGCLIGGHAVIGDFVTIGMGVAIRDNIEIGERTQVGMGSIVTRSIGSNLSIYGNPARIVPPIQAGPSR